MSEKVQILLMIIVVLIAASIPITIGVGKYQVCKTYFPELQPYVCLFTNLPALNLGSEEK